jgi:hypothetical protein|tara:strand:+ start:471 stop:770 length:300 start_codon:yes stop_codon:yes gene_type:complete
MPKSTTAKKASPTATAKKSAKRPLADIAKTTTEKKVNAGGLNLDAIILDNPDKIARAQHNQERHKDMSGKTIRDALATRRVDARDIRYDLQKGFMTIKS